MMTKEDFPSEARTELSTLTIQEAGVTREKILSETRYVLGRGSDCPIPLADSNVSRHHAELKFDGSAWVITDLGSANGTFVNGSPVSSAVLKHLDAIQIGSVVLVINEPHRAG